MIKELKRIENVHIFAEGLPRLDLRTSLAFKEICSDLAFEGEPPDLYVAGASCCEEESRDVNWM
jgi:hypothetical protein